MIRLILHINEGSDGILALRAARALIRDGYRECVYGFEGGAYIYAYRTRTGIAAREEPTPEVLADISARAA